ncbi:hypothetical protein Y1Q_0002991 [Alligator mississippiensis]|uniref:Uncharacterized protein n=1 Tax=Alligator mississippiensis TaxID=8496 RepID=A0A151MD05_ALLMI|nr:hypothetical protein Y1Q_0002991 [Alligator mississippiensis]
MFKFSKTEVKTCLVNKRSAGSSQSFLAAILECSISFAEGTSLLAAAAERDGCTCVAPGSEGRTMSS